MLSWPNTGVRLTADLDGLLTRFDALAKEVVKVARQGKKILVVTHLDADGLASGAIIFTALSRKQANVTVRSVPDLVPEGIAELAGLSFDYLIFTDLGATLIKELSAAFDGRYLVVDHHQLAEEYMASTSVVNAWQYGFDGGREACSSTMAYFFARAIDDGNRDLSHLAVVGAVADRQDSGPGRSLTGLNRKALEDAQSAGLVTVTKDLAFTGRETRPVHEAIALTSTPYMPGLTGSKDAALAALLKSGLELKVEGRWRTTSELSPEEKMKLTELIASVAASGGSGADVINGLVGDVYVLQYEDSFTPLRDAREFATLLNACGRTGGAGLGMAVCMGDRSDSLRQAMKSLSDYRAGISKAISGIVDDPSRIERHGQLVMVKADGIVDEKMLGPVTSILTSFPEYRDRVVVARTDAGESEIKISGRVGDFYQGTVNLAATMKEVAEAIGGVGGGHSMAAGAKIPRSQGEPFAKLLLRRMGA